jgi:hypothetical protein
MSGLGHLSYIQTGPKETTYGTPVAPTKKIEIEKWDFEPQIGEIPDSSLYGGQSRRAIHQGLIFYQGSFITRANYEGHLEFFRAALGTYSNSLVETGVRDHVFLSDGAGSAKLNSYSPEVVAGDIPVGKCFRALGLKHAGLTIRVTAGQGDDAMVKFEWPTIGRDYESDLTPTGSLVFPSVLPVRYHDTKNAGGVVDDGTGDTAANVRIRSAEIVLAAPHTGEERAYLGSQLIDEPLRSDFLDVTWKLTQEFKTKTQFEAAKAFTTGSPRLVFQDPTTIGVSSKREFEVRSGSAKLVGWSAPVEGYGIIISTATWRAFYDPTDLCALYCRFRNTESALT